MYTLLCSHVSLLHGHKWTYGKKRISLCLLNYTFGWLNIYADFSFFMCDENRKFMWFSNNCRCVFLMLREISIQNRSHLKNIKNCQFFGNLILIERVIALYKSSWSQFQFFFKLIQLNLIIICSVVVCELISGLLLSKTTSKTHVRKTKQWPTNVLICVVILHLHMSVFVDYCNVRGDYYYFMFLILFK